VALTLVPPAEPPEPTGRDAIAKRLIAKTPSHLLTCKRCASLEFIETVTGVEVTADGKRRRGTKSLICLHCFRRGERVEAT
jgi:hypothetical protein